MDDKYLSNKYIRIEKFKYYFYICLKVIIAAIFCFILSVLFIYLLYIGLHHLYINKTISDDAYTYYTSVGGGVISTIITVVYASISSQMSFYKSMRYNRYNFLMPLFNTMNNAINNSFDLVDMISEFEKAKSENDISLESIEKLLKKVINNGNNLTRKLNNLLHIDSDFPHLKKFIDNYKDALKGEKDFLNNFNFVMNINCPKVVHLNSTNIVNATDDLMYIQYAVGNLTKLNE